MGERKEEDLYRNFSRKDLQGLCKKYGLPANKSNSEMATSLILFLEKKNLSSRAICEGTSADSFAFRTTELQAGVRMNLTDDMRKDRGRMASHSGPGNNQHHNHQVAKLNELQQCQGFATSDKGSQDVGVLTQLYKESNSGAGIPENTFSSVVSSSVVSPSPTFTFDVCCEDGIQLSVDLDSSPSDWIESLKAGVHICHDMHKPKSQTFHEDIGLLSCSKQKTGSVMNQSDEADKGQPEDGSYPTTISTDIQAQTDKADGGDTFLASPELKSLTNAGHSSDNIKELQAILSSRLQSESGRQLPSARSSGSDETVVNDLDVNSLVQTGASNLKGNLQSDPQCSGMPAHQGARASDGMDKPPLPQSYSSLEPLLRCSESSTTVCVGMQASSSATMSKDIDCSPFGVGKCVDLSEQLRNTKMVQCGAVNSVQHTPSKDEHLMWPVEAVDQSKGMSCSPLLKSLSPNLADNSSKVDAEHGKAPFSRKSDRHVRAAQTPSAENARYLTKHKVGRETDEMKKKDAALYPCSSGRPLNLVVPEKNGVGHCISTKTTECKEEVSRSPSAANVETLGKSNIGNGREGSECVKFDKLKPWKRFADSESTTDLKGKRHFNSVEGQKFVNDEAKTLRSSKQSAGDAHSKRRRSSRLFTK